MHTKSLLEESPGCEKKKIRATFGVYVSARDQPNINCRGSVKRQVCSTHFMSLDFFFVPLAAKAGASLDQVKASRG